MSPSSTSLIETRLRESLRKRRSVITDEDVEVLARVNAAIKIQRAWRAKKRASYLGTDFLWTDLVTHARLKVSGEATVYTRSKNLLISDLLTPTLPPC